jgi:hypothetical protein
MPPFTEARRGCNANATTTQQGECPPWHFLGNRHECVLGEDCGEVVIGDGDLSALKLGYCMTYSDDENLTTLVACPYDIASNHSYLVKGLYVTMNTNLSELNAFTCDHLNREGEHCARCRSNHGQSIFTMNLGCYSCTRAYRGWGLYLFLEITLLTVFIIVLLLLQLSPTKPSLKSFVLFSQLAVVSLSLNYEPLYNHVYESKAHTLVKIIKVCYGFWNLDFFRSVIPPFCVDHNVDNFEVMAFHYISIVYPSLLTAIAWIAVDLHEKGFRPVVRMWKPFQRYLSHYSVTSNPKRTIVSFFATITVLSYTKVIYISVNLLNVAELHTICGKNDTQVMFLQPDVTYFSPKHGPYAVLAFVMSFTFIVLPLLILLLYPIGWVQDKLKSCCVSHTNIQVFVEVFQECYSDGSNDTKDRRLFSTAYLFHRILVVMILVKGVGNIAAYMIIALLHGIMVGLLFGLKPYKQDAYNYLDILFFLVFGLAFLFSAFASHNYKLYNVIFSGVFIAVLVPFLYISIRVLVLLVNWLKLVDLKTILQWRRRGYAEIGEYGIEQSVSLSAGEVNLNRQRSTDSLQSE